MSKPGIRVAEAQATAAAVADGSWFSQGQVSGPEGQREGNVTPARHGPVSPLLEQTLVSADTNAEFSDFGRDPRFPAGWWLVLGLLTGLATLALLAIGMVRAVVWLI